MLQALACARAGDPDALDRLARGAREELLRSLSPRLKGGWTEAWLEDVVQAALLDICRHVGACRARTEEELLAWVHSIGRREVANLCRAEARWREGCNAFVEQQEDEASDLGPADAPETLSAHQRVLRRRLARVSPSGHEILWMRLAEHATWGEIARALGITQAGAKRRYQRLMTRLRRGGGGSGGQAGPG